MNEYRGTDLDKCPYCKKGVIELVPLNDKDQLHKGEMLCVFCKRKKRRVKKVIIPEETKWGI